MAKAKPHECQAIAALLADSDCPVQFDEDLNEYNLVSKSGDAYYRMYFCFFCGAELPKSRRAELYTQPSEGELEEVKELLSNARTVDDVVNTLGESDNKADPPPEEAAAGMNYAKHLRYSKRWKSLDLIVRSRTDNSFEAAVVGKLTERTTHSTQ